MNRKAIAIVPVIVMATLALTAVSFGLHSRPSQGDIIPHNHNNRNNPIDVSQQINQLNNCTQALCANEAQNQAFIHR